MILLQIAKQLFQPRDTVEISRREILRIPNSRSIPAVSMILALIVTVIWLYSVVKVKVRDWKKNSLNKRNYSKSMSQQCVTTVNLIICRQNSSIQTLQSELRSAPKQEYVNKYVCGSFYLLLNAHGW